MGKPLDAFAGEKLEGVGWVTQVQLASDETWVSWTQWREPDVAVRHARKLLEDHAQLYLRARVVRVDWTVIEVLEHEADR